MLKFGVRVVCVNDVFTEEQKSLIPVRPVRDQDYTVDEVLLTRRGKAITLVELDNPPLVHPTGLGTFFPSFDVNRFRVMEEPAVQSQEKQEALLA